MRICFVAPTAVPFRDPACGAKQVGGAELQQSIIAKGLAARGHDISMICLDHDQKDGVKFDGVKIFKCHKPNAGIPVLRFVHPRFTGLWAAMHRADAELYYQRTAGGITGFVAAFCKRNNKVSVFCGAGNPDFNRNTDRIRFKRDRLLYEYGLRTVNQILVQNIQQSRLCQSNFGRPSIVVPNCYEPPDSATADPNGYVLWVSTIRALKNPKAFVELARKLPDLKFRMIGGAGPGEDDLYQQILKEAAPIPNLDFRGFIPFSEIEPHFNGARVLVNTSESEGFPNTFLQSWSRGIPTISFIDSGASLDGDPIGCIADSQRNLEEITRSLMTADEQWREFGIRAKTYFEENNTVVGAIETYESVFGALVESSRKDTCET